MRNLVLYSLMSLDGVAEEPANLGAIIERHDDIILGRGTYDYRVDYWPTADVGPFATFVNSTPSTPQPHPHSASRGTTLTRPPNRRSVLRHR